MNLWREVKSEGWTWWCDVIDVNDETIVKSKNKIKKSLETFTSDPVLTLSLLVMSSPITNAMPAVDSFSCFLLP